MTTHLDTTTLDGYLSRSLDRQQLAELEDHVSTCFRCSLAIETAGLDERHWERRGVFGRLVRR
jgi:hypothetical protein